jgi:hypothetical protein
MKHVTSLNTVVSVTCRAAPFCNGCCVRIKSRQPCLKVTGEVTLWSQVPVGNLTVA